MNKSRVIRKLFYLIAFAAVLYLNNVEFILSPGAYWVCYENTDYLCTAPIWNPPDIWCSGWEPGCVCCAYPKYNPSCCGWGSSAWCCSEGGGTDSVCVPSYTQGPAPYYLCNKTGARCAECLDWHDCPDLDHDSCCYGTCYLDMDWSTSPDAKHCCGNGCENDICGKDEECCDTDGDGIDGACCPPHTSCVWAYEWVDDECVISSTKKMCKECDYDGDCEDIHGSPDWKCCGYTCYDSDANDDGITDHGCCNAADLRCENSVWESDCSLKKKQDCCNTDEDPGFDMAEYAECGSHSEAVEQEIQERCTVIAWPDTMIKRCPSSLDAVWEECGPSVCKDNACRWRIECTSNSQCSPDYRHCGMFSSGAWRHNNDPCWCKKCYCPDADQDDVCDSPMVCMTSASDTITPPSGCYIESATCERCDYSDWNDIGKVECCEEHACEQYDKVA